MDSTASGRIEQQWKGDCRDASSERKHRCSPRRVSTRIYGFRIALFVAVASSLFESSFLFSFQHGIVDAREIRTSIQYQSHLRSRQLEDLWDDDELLGDGDTPPEPAPSPTQDPTAEQILDTNNPTVEQILETDEPTIPPFLDTDIPSDFPSAVPSEAPTTAQDPTPTEAPSAVPRPNPTT
jgi:hypothetical protein